MEVALGSKKVCLGNASSDPPTLVQFRPAWTEQAYLRFAEIPHRVENTPHAENAVSGAYPQLRDGHFLLPSRDVIDHLKSYRKDIDDSLTPLQVAESNAMACMVREELGFLLEALRWSASDGSGKKIRMSALRRVLPGALRFWYPWWTRRQVHAQLVARAMDDFSPDTILAKMRSRYADLDVRLGSNISFFFGGDPCSLDSYLFGHLADALADPALVVVLPGFANLMRYFRNIFARYFSPTSSYSASTLWGSSLERANFVNASNPLFQLQDCEFISTCPPCAHDPFPPRARESGRDVIKPFKEEQPLARTAEESNLMWLGSAAAGIGLFLLMKIANSFTVYIEDEDEEGEGYDDEDDDQDDDQRSPSRY